MLTEQDIFEHKRLLAITDRGHWDVHGDRIARNNGSILSISRDSDAGTLEDLEHAYPVDTPDHGIGERL